MRRSLLACLTFLVLTVGFGNQRAQAAGCDSAVAISSPITCSVTITLTIPELILVSSVDDFTFGTFDGSTDFDSTDDVCVWTNTGNYNLTATGSGTAGAFTLQGTGANTDVVAYTPTWYTDAGGTGTPVTLTTGVATSTLATAAADPLCAGGGPSASLQVGVTATEMQARNPDDYTGTLTLVFEVE